MLDKTIQVTDRRASAMPVSAEEMPAAPASICSMSATAEQKRLHMMDIAPYTGQMEVQLAAPSLVGYQAMPIEKQRPVYRAKKSSKHADSSSIYAALVLGLLAAGGGTAIALLGKKASV